MDWKSLLSQLAEDSIRAKRETVDACGEAVARAAQVMIDALRGGRKILACGNGGSAADAQHFAAEIVGRFERERRPMPAVSLTANTSNLTAIANDYGFDEVFARQVAGMAVAGDVLLAISTSGNSPNVLRAIEAAKRAGAKTIGLTGRDGGAMAAACDVCVVVPANNTARIQETHIFLIHFLCQAVESTLFGEK